MPLDGFRGEVFLRAEDDAFARGGAFVGASAFGARVADENARVVFFVDGDGEVEVAQRDVPRPRLVHEDVLGLDVPVREPRVSVHVVDRERHLGGVVPRLGLGEADTASASAARDQRGEGERGKKPAMSAARAAAPSRQHEVRDVVRDEDVREGDEQARGGGRAGRGVERAEGVHLRADARARGGSGAPSKNSAPGGQARGTALHTRGSSSRGASPRRRHARTLRAGAGAAGGGAGGGGSGGQRTTRERARRRASRARSIRRARKIAHLANPPRATTSPSSYASAEHVARLDADARALGLVGARAHPRRARDGSGGRRANGL